MSHTYFHGNTIFICNSDLSGDITIQNERGEFVVFGGDLLSFVGEYIRSERVAELENTDPLEFIK